MEASPHAATAAEFVADESVERVGVTTHLRASERRFVKLVLPGSWAERSGICQGDEVLTVNRISVLELSQASFHEEMLRRPLRLTVSKDQSDLNEVCVPGRASPRDCMDTTEEVLSQSVVEAIPTEKAAPQAVVFSGSSSEDDASADETTRDRRLSEEESYVDRLQHDWRFELLNVMPLEKALAFANVLEQSEQQYEEASARAAQLDREVHALQRRLSERSSSGAVDTLLSDISGADRKRFVCEGLHGAVAKDFVEDSAEDACDHVTKVDAAAGLSLKLSGEVNGVMFKDFHAVSHIYGHAHSSHKLPMPPSDAWLPRLPSPRVAVDRPAGTGLAPSPPSPIRRPASRPASLDGLPSIQLRPRFRVILAPVCLAMMAVLFISLSSAAGPRGFGIGIWLHPDADLRHEIALRIPSWTFTLVDACAWPGVQSLTRLPTYEDAGVWMSTSASMAASVYNSTALHLPALADIRMWSKARIQEVRVLIFAAAATVDFTVLAVRVRAVAESILARSIASIRRCSARSAAAAKALTAVLASSATVPQEPPPLAPVAESPKSAEAKQAGSLAPARFEPPRELVAMQQFLDVCEAEIVLLEAGPAQNPDQLQELGSDGGGGLVRETRVREVTLRETRVREYDPGAVAQLREEHAMMEKQLEHLMTDVETALREGRDMVCWPVGTGD